MELEFEINEYLLAWYLLYSASLSKEIDKFRKNLYTKYKKEYNFCYKDKGEILKYGHDFIPDNDILYNEIFNSDLYLSLKKETMKHKMHLVRLFHNNNKLIKKCVKEVLKVSFKEPFLVYIVHPRMEIVEYNESTNSLVWGSDKDKYDVFTILLLAIVKGKYGNIYQDNKEIVDAIIELSVINEIGNKLENVNSYQLGNPTLRIIKRQIYPFWLMYLGYNTKEELLDKMMEDKIAFDLDKYPIDKKMQRLTIEEFLSFCVKNSKHILKLGNVLKIEQEEEIEVI